jgi:hypothetical protein
LRWSGPRWSPPAESNRRHHPCHGTTGNRCADRRFPRSRPTVGAEVIGSLSAKLNALLVRSRFSDHRADHCLLTLSRLPLYTRALALHHAHVSGCCHRRRAGGRPIWGGRRLLQPSLATSPGHLPRTRGGGSGLRRDRSLFDRGVGHGLPTTGRRATRGTLTIRAIRPTLLGLLRPEAVADSTALLRCPPTEGHRRAAWWRVDARTHHRVRPEVLTSDASRWLLCHVILRRTDAAAAQSGPLGRRRTST